METENRSILAKSWNVLRNFKFRTLAISRSELETWPKGYMVAFCKPFVQKKICIGYLLYFLHDAQRDGPVNRNITSRITNLSREGAFSSWPLSLLRYFLDLSGCVVRFARAVWCNIRSVCHSSFKDHFGRFTWSIRHAQCCVHKLQPAFSSSH